VAKDFVWPHVRALPYFRSLLRSVEAEFYQQVELPSPVLDVGAGDGHFASVVLPHPVDAGLDPQLPSLREARRRGCYRLLVVSGGHHMPFADASFASALSNSVLEHIPEVEGVLTEIGRVLQTGAPFLFTVPNDAFPGSLSVSGTLRRWGANGLAQSYQEAFVRISRHHNMFDEQGWGERLADAGLEVVRTFRYFPPRSLHAMEWGHYFGAPCLPPRMLTGRWILAPYRWNLWLTDRIVRRYHDPSPRPDGAYSCYLARKR
jgi:SAM-dependent methyltransferase